MSDMDNALFALLCPVCYAPADPVVRESVNVGIFVLLGVTTVVLVGVIRFITAIARRSKAVAIHDGNAFVNH